jgi:hypothetical protein
VESDSWCYWMDEICPHRCMVARERWRYGHGDTGPENLAGQPSHLTVGVKAIFSVWENLLYFPRITYSCSIILWLKIFWLNTKNCLVLSRRIVPILSKPYLAREWMKDTGRVGCSRKAVSRRTQPLPLSLFLSFWDSSTLQNFMSSDIPCVFTQEIQVLI